MRKKASTWSKERIASTRCVEQSAQDRTLPPLVTPIGSSRPKHPPTSCRATLWTCDGRAPRSVTSIVAVTSKPNIRPSGCSWESVRAKPPFRRRIGRTLTMVNCFQISAHLFSYCIGSLPKEVGCTVQISLWDAPESGSCLVNNWWAVQSCLADCLFSLVRIKFGGQTLHSHLMSANLSWSPKDKGDSAKWMVSGLSGECILLCSIPWWLRTNVDVFQISPCERSLA
jgi:hypothetical protein